MEGKINVIMTFTMLIFVLYFGVLIIDGGFYSKKYGMAISFGQYNLTVGGIFIAFSLYWIIKILLKIKD